jgi:hypothetical protein
MEPGELIEKYGTTFRFRGLFGVGEVAVLNNISAESVAMMNRRKDCTP